MRQWRKSCLLCLAFVSTPLAAEVAIERLDIEQPRSFGYRIGDKFERVIDLELRKPYHLDDDALPAPGRLSEWLQLEAPLIEREESGEATRYRIRLVYQIVNINPEVRDVAVTSHHLSYGDGDDESIALVPATRISVALMDTHSGGVLQPDHVPAATAPRYTRAAIYAAILVAALTGLALITWGLPFAARSRPFARAYRRLLKRRRAAWDDDAYRETLRDIHRAFNATSGATVFPETLAGFLERHPQFALQAAALSEYFQHSRRYFFESANDVEEAPYPDTELVTLLRACRDAERDG